MGLSQCLICCQEVSSIDASLSFGIDKQLDIIFILKELFGLPSISLGKWLEIFPEVNPASWIRLCGDCGEMVGKGRAIFEEIVEASKRFKVVQEKVVEKLKLSQRTDILEGSKRKITRKTNFKRKCGRLKVEDVGVRVAEECRQFVTEHDYGYFHDPFPLGDLEAQRKLGKRNDIAAIKEDNEISEEDDLHLSASPASMEDNTDLQDMEEDWGTLNQLEEPQDIDEEPGGLEDSSQDDDYQPPTKKAPRKKRIKEEGAFYLDNGKVAFRCQFPDCGQVYRSKESYHSHKLRHSNEPPSFLCDRCHKTFISQHLLNRHIRDVHVNPRKQIITTEVREAKKIRNQRKCPHCDKVMDKYTLAKHIKMVHEKIYPFYCEICGKGQNNKTIMKYHQAEVHGICSVPNCKSTFPGDRVGLRDHQLQVHGQEVDVWKCEDCDKLFMWMQNLQNHRKVVHDKLENDKTTQGDGEEEDKQWICHLCGRHFRLKILLSNHMGNHRNKPPKKRKKVKDNPTNIPNVIFNYN